MSFLEKILGPKSKYDKRLPYTHEARVRMFEEGDEHRSYFSDTIRDLNKTCSFKDRDRTATGP